MSEEEYVKINQSFWNNAVPLHVDSDFYNLQQWKEGATSLHSIEMELLGDVTNQSLLHVQCHFGQDTLSLARMGAIVTGTDLSTLGIKEAQKLNMELNLNANFICCDTYAIPKTINRQFDVVYTSYGVIGWLPDINRWAKVVASSMKPGGKFVFVEFHPMVWMFNDDFTHVKHRYFNSDPIVETQSSTYASNKETKEFTSMSWNHSIGEVISALLSEGLHLDTFNEFDYSPYNCLEGMIEIEKNKYRIEKFGNKFPLVYALSATKPNS